MKNILVILALVTPLISIAQQGSGNGGDAVVCPEGIYMLDSVESMRRKQPVSINVSKENLRAKLNLLLSRVKTRDEELAKELTSRTKLLYKDIIKYEETGDINQESIDFTDGELVNIADEGATYIPSGCKIKQLIIQNKSPLPGNKKFIFQKELWDDMSLTEKAVAVFHEAIYGYLLDNGLNDSQTTRFYNGLVISGQLDKLQDKFYYDTVLEIGLPKKAFGKFGLIFELKSRWSPGVGYHAINDLVDNLSYNADGSIAKINFAAFADGGLNYIKGSQAKATFAEEIEIKGTEWVKLRVAQDSILGNRESVFELNSMHEIKADYMFGGKKLWACHIQDMNALKGTVISTSHYPSKKGLMLSKIENGYKLTGANIANFKRSIGLVTLSGCTHKIFYSDVSLNLDVDFSILSIDKTED